MQLNFPTYNFKLKNLENGNYIFDIIRKKYVLLTPEEWVRQHLLHYMVSEMRCPASLVGVEKGLTVNRLKKRFDVLAYHTNGQPVMLAECKSPDIKLDESVFRQAAIYNTVFRVKLLLITNGLEHFFCIYGDDFSTFTLHKGLPVGV